METIDVTAAGPIEGTFEIDLSPGPGAYEFRGKRGSGKSTCISSIDWLAGHKVDITLHDGALSGKVEGFGVVAPIGGRKRRKGELDLDTIDAEKFSLSDILDPQGKSAEVRDATRIKAIAALSGATADPALYYDLAGGQSEYDALGVSPTPDPVLLASRIKQAFDKLARERQNTADAEAGHAAPLEHVPPGVDMDAESDLSVLSAARDNARDALQEMKAERLNGIATEQAAKSAAYRLAKVQEDYSGPTVEAATAAAHAAALADKKATDAVLAAQEALNKRESQSAEAHAASNLAIQTLETAQQHEEAVTALQDKAKSARAYCTPEEIADAERAVATATEAYNQGVRVRDAKRNHIRAKAHREAAIEAEQEAASAKNKAGEVFDLLAQSLNTTYLEVQAVDGDPRLFVRHPKRGRTAFDRVNGLSDGERVDFTLRELLPHLEAPGLLPIPQRVWQDLQPSDRTHLHALAVEKNLYLFGAQVDDGDLRVVFLNGEEMEQ